MDLSGIFPPLSTPFTTDGAIDVPGLRTNLERLKAEPLAGFVVGGSNGEYTSMTTDERVQVVEIVRAATPGRLLIAGAGLESTAGTVSLTARMAGAGADAVLVVTPAYFKARMTPGALAAHFSAVADASPVPVILYSVPANTGIDLPAEVVAQLSRHANIIGLKDSGGDITKFGRMASECPPDFQLLAGSAGFLLAALTLGAVGGIMALANVAAGSLHELVDRFRVGDLAGARALQLRLIQANTAVTARFGVAGLKAALDMQGLVGGSVRPPLLPLLPSERQELESTLERAGMLPR